MSYLTNILFGAFWGPAPAGRWVRRAAVSLQGLSEGGAMGVSFKMRKRSDTGKDSARRGQRRRAARLHLSFPCFTLHGYSQEALRPPHPSPKADHRAATSSFLYFERDPHGPAGTGMAQGAGRSLLRRSNFGYEGRTVQGKTINAIRGSTVHRVAWTVYRLWGCLSRGGI
jgi:hypothetical protein